MIKSLFWWIDHNPWFYWTLVLLSASALVWTSWRTPQRKERTWWWALAIFGFILAGRWPFLFTADELDPDEAQWVAGALTLWFKDPVFFRAVDGTTSGPLNFYALWYARLFGLPIDFFSARLLAIALASGAVICTGLALRMRWAARPARCAVLPAAIFFGLNTNQQFIHYSSEHVSLFLLAAGVWRLLAADSADAAGRWRALRWLAVGSLLGLAPWAKFQAAPAAIPLLLWAAFLIWKPRPDQGVTRRGRVCDSLALAVGALWPALVVGLGLWHWKVWDVFYNGYIAYGAYYMRTGQPVSAGEVAWELWRASRTGLFPALMTGLATASAISVVLAGRKTFNTFLFTAILWFGSSVTAVLLPHRVFPHYLLYLVMPATFLTGTLLGAAWDNARAPFRRFGAGFATAVVLAPVLFVYAQLPAPLMLGRLWQHWREPRTALGRALKPVLQPREPLAVWGWRARAYVENGNVQATRCPHAERMILASPLREYHRQRYLRDFAASRPRVFVDATGPGDYFYEDRAQFGHETFPELAALIARDFSLFADLGDARIYVRKDQPTP